eukprot:3207896-Pleurochrysis_carterae.AAC.1
MDETIHPDSQLRMRSDEFDENLRPFSALDLLHTVALRALTTYLYRSKVDPFIPERGDGAARRRIRRRPRQLPLPLLLLQRLDLGSFFDRPHALISTPIDNEIDAGEFCSSSEIPNPSCTAAKKDGKFGLWAAGLSDCVALALKALTVLAYNRYMLLLQTYAVKIMRTPHAPLSQGFLRWQFYSQPISISAAAPQVLSKSLHWGAQHVRSNLFSRPVANAIWPANPASRRPAIRPCSSPGKSPQPEAPPSPSLSLKAKRPSMKSQISQFGLELLGRFCKKHGVQATYKYAPSGTPQKPKFRCEIQLPLPPALQQICGRPRLVCRGGSIMGKDAATRSATEAALTILHEDFDVDLEALWRDKRILAASTHAAGHANISATLRRSAPDRELRDALYDLFAIAVSAPKLERHETFTSKEGPLLQVLRARQSFRGSFQAGNGSRARRLSAVESDAQIGRIVE